MARKCEICGTRNVGTGKNAGYEDTDFSRRQGFCNPCGNEAQHEIAHDNGHESITEDECWLCHPEMNDAKKTHTPRTGHTNTVAKTHTSHAGHKHTATPYYRALCRKSMAAGHGPYDMTAPKV